MSNAGQKGPHESNPSLTAKAVPQRVISVPRLSSGSLAAVSPPRVGSGEHALLPSTTETSKPPSSRGNLSSDSALAAPSPSSRREPQPSAPGSSRRLPPAPPKRVLRTSESQADLPSVVAATDTPRSSVAPSSVSSRVASTERPAPSSAQPSSAPAASPALAIADASAALSNPLPPLPPAPSTPLPLAAESGAPLFAAESSPLIDAAALRSPLDSEVTLAPAVTRDEPVSPSQAVRGRANIAPRFVMVGAAVTICAALGSLMLLRGAASSTANHVDMTPLPAANASPNNLPPSETAEHPQLAAPASATASPPPTAPAGTPLARGESRPPEDATTSAEASLFLDGSEVKAPSCEQLLSSATDGPGKSAYDYLRAARQLLVRGDLDGSQRAFCQAARGKGQDGNILIELAQLLLLRRDGGSAAEWAQRALSLEPRNARALNILGDAQLRAGNLESGRRALLQAASRAPEDASAARLLVQRDLEEAEHCAKSDPARAERLLRRIVAFEPQNVLARSKLAAALSRQGFSHSAELWNRSAAELAASAAR